jgi:hypothetical protein
MMSDCPPQGAPVTRMGNPRGLLAHTRRRESAACKALGRAAQARERLRMLAPLGLGPASSKHYKAP